ncbi:MAG: thioesterase family protein [Gammaproteobacteria bacterium]
MQRTDYLYFHSIPTRWVDNDVYGHVNNINYYSFFDTVIGHYLITEGGLDYRNSPIIGLCVESQCQFQREIAFPDVVEAGLRVAKIGNSSVRYEIGLFTENETKPAARGYFVHVFVNREQRRPVPVPDRIRSALSQLASSNSAD